MYLAPAQDHKRALDGDRGENTGGLGAYAPAPVVDAAVEAKVRARIVEPVLAGMRDEGRPYRGVLYVGLMIQNGDPKVVEFNVRFGDPEAQALLFQLEADLVPLLVGAAEGRLPSGSPELAVGPPAVCVVLASPGYPRRYPTGLPISGLDALADVPDVLAFHAGTRRGPAGWETAGGRILGITARGPTVAEARERAYSAVERVSFEGAQCRSDIAARALAR